MKHFKEFLPYIIIILIVIMVRTFIVTPVRVDGSSMDPTLKNGELLILNKFEHSYHRFDIVVLKYNKTKLIKRIVGLPGDHLYYKNNHLYINGKKIEENFTNMETNDFKLEYLGVSKIPKGYYFVMGDNRTHSMDSRMIGLVKEKDIYGNATLRLFPFSKIGKIDKK